MNYIKVKVIDWGFKLLTLGVLVATLFSVVNGQHTANPAEIERMKLEAKEKQEKAILIIKQGLVDHTLVSDPEINLAATMIKLASV